VPFTLPLPLAITAAVFMVAALAGMAWSTLQTRALRKRILRSARLGDPQFLDAMGAPTDDRALLLAIRKTMAGLCDLPPELIQPQQLMHDVCRLIQGWDGWDDANFLEALEQELGVELPPDIELPAPAQQEPFGQWITRVASIIRLLVVPARPIDPQPGAGAAHAGEG